MTANSAGEKLCPNFKLLALVEDERTKQFSCVVQFSSVFGDPRRIWIKRADFYDAKLLSATLKNSGAQFSPDDDVNEEAVNRLIASGENAEKWKIAANAGWRSDDEQFVLQYETIGVGDPAVRVLPPGASDETRISKLGRKGTLKGWRKRVAKPARYSSRMVLGICAAFAAPLLKYAGINSFGIQISGPAKTSRSTGLVAAASTLGFGHESDLPNFRATDAALGELPYEFNDCLFPLNELALLKGHDRARQERMRDFAYGLSEGSGTAYSKFFTQKSTLQWRTIALANSEESAEELAQKAGMARMGGEAIRWIDVPALRKGRTTMFDRAPSKLFENDESGWAKAISKKIRKGAQNNHGAAMCRFIELAMERRDSIASDVKAKSKLFGEAVARTSDGPSVLHLASCFALLYAAGALAAELDIVPWSEDVVLRCIKRCYFDAKRAMRTPEELQRNGLKILAKRLADGRLLTVAKEIPKAMAKADGYVVTAGMSQKITVRAERFKSWFPDQRQPRLVLDWLIKNGAIVPSGEPDRGNGVGWARSQKTWPNGTRVRSIVIDLPLHVRKLLPH